MLFKEIVEIFFLSNILIESIEDDHGDTWIFSQRLNSNVIGSN